MMVAHDVNPILATWTGSCTSPTAAPRPAPRDEVITSETLTAAVPDADRGAARPSNGRLVVVGDAGGARPCTRPARSDVSGTP